MLGLFAHRPCSVPAFPEFLYFQEHLRMHLHIFKKQESENRSQEAGALCSTCLPMARTYVPSVPLFSRTSPDAPSYFEKQESSDTLHLTPCSSFCFHTHSGLERRFSLCAVSNAPAKTSQPRRVP